MSNKYLDVWTKELLPKLEKNYKKVFDKWIDHESFSIYKNEENALNEIKSTSTRDFNALEYNVLKYAGIPLSLICFVFPYFFAKKKLDALTLKKKQIENEISEVSDQKLKANQLLVNNFNFSNLIKSQYQTLGYQHYGPITASFINELQDLSLFELNNSTNYNTYNTSWGVIDNKIIINFACQIHRFEDVTYNNNYRVSSKYYPTTYTHSSPRIETKTQSFVFMQSCSNLEFEYQDEYFGKLLKKENSRNKNQSKLENDIFENNLLWIRNDEIQFRMIFTLLGQENYINEILATSKTKVFDEFKYAKNKAFFSNKYFRKSPFMFANNELNLLQNKFISDSHYNLNTFECDLKTAISDHLHDFYLSLNYLWIIPIFATENHFDIIQRIIKKQNGKPTIALFHYLLNEILQFKIIEKDTDTFHQVLNIDNYLYENTYIATIKGLSYETANEIYKSPVLTTNGMVYANISYIGYIPFSKIGFVFYKYLNTSLFYIPKLSETNIKDKKILDLIYQLNDLKIGVVLNEGYLVMYSLNNDFKKNKISNLILQLLNSF